MKNQLTEKLFSYGTLQQESVQLSTFGRRLKGTRDALEGYYLKLVKITDPKVILVSGNELHPALTLSKNKSDKVEGTVFDVTSQELLQADKYEEGEYKRIQIRTHLRNLVWVYIGITE